METTAQSRRIGLNDIYYAILTSDTSTGTTYDTPVPVIGAVAASVQPKTNMAVFYQDDGAAETATAIGEITVDFEVGILPTAVVAALLGATIGNDGTMLQKSSDVAPYVALGFRSLKANGKYRYKWLYKGKFQWVNETFKTMDGKPEGQTEKIAGTFVRRASDNALQITADEDDSAFTGGATWFNAVQDQDTSTAAPTVTVTPANNASEVADNSTVVWVFSQPMQPATVTAANFFVIDPTGTGIAGALSLSSDQKTVTFTPTSAFAAATKYTAIATSDALDLAGVGLAANSVTNFTTA